MAQNKSLQDQIDILRRDRVAFLDIRKNVSEQLEKKNEVIDKIAKVITNRKDKTIDTQYQIHLLKSKNEEEKAHYSTQFDELQKQIKEDRKEKELKMKYASKPKDKIENFDTHTLLKRRLQKIILVKINK